MPMMDFVLELLDFIDELASGKLKIEDARQRAAALQARQPERFTDALETELNARIAALEGASDR